MELYACNSSTKEAEVERAQTNCLGYLEKPIQKPKKQKTHPIHAYFTKH